MKTPSKFAAAFAALHVPQAACLMLVAALAGCASKPKAPDWQANSHSSLDASVDAYLKGDSAIAETEFARARREIAATGRPELVARAELVRCAARVASLDVDACTGFDALAQDASAAERAYAAYLAGQWQGLDAALLPEQHRAVVGGKGALAAVGDPLSRLVAAGAMMRAGRLGPAEVTVAAETASAQGWRRPLLAWLGVALMRAKAGGDSAQVARLERRIALAQP
jgi:hypothetical protein